MSIFMSSSVASPEPGNPSPSASPQQPVGLRDSDREDAITLFDRAVTEAMKELDEKADGIAKLVLCSGAHLSDFRAGRRVIALYRVVALCLRSKTAALVFARFFAALAGKHVADKRNPTKPEFHQQLALDLLANPALLEPVLVRTARRFGMELGEAQQFLSDV